MVMRTGTYVAFDGQGEIDPSKSDFKYYATLQAWVANKDIKFNLINSHEKTYSVRDDSSLETLESRICERLRMSKNMLVVLTCQTRKVGSMLSYEIQKAVDYYGIPMIIAYPEYKYIMNVESHRDIWPEALKVRIDKGLAKAIHIPFKIEPIFDAISRFTVHDNILTHGRHCYARSTYKQWGLL